jgi:hypothetical protein
MEIGDRSQEPPSSEDTVAIAEEPPVEVASSQQVRDKAQKDNGDMDTLHKYMQELARVETSKIMDQKRERLAVPENSEMTIPSPKERNLPDFLLTELAETDIESPEQDKNFTKPVKGKRLKRLAQKVKRAAQPIKGIQLKRLAQKVKRAVQPIKRIQLKGLAQKVKRAVQPIKGMQLNRLVQKVQSAAKPLKEKYWAR